MELDFQFFLTAFLLGIGLAMDAFSVSLANGLNEPCMRKRKMTGVAGTFALFQALMPMLGWVCIHTIVEKFKAFEKMIPWIALILLCYIGGKMLYDSLKHRGCECEEKPKVGFVGLIVPHGVRKLTGGESLWLVLCSALGGAALVAVCDLLARLAFAPYELPVGVLLSFIGGPFFLYVILRQRGGRRRA